MSDQLRRQVSFDETDLSELENGSPIGGLSRSILRGSSGVAKMDSTPTGVMGTSRMSSKPVSRSRSMGNFDETKAKGKDLASRMPETSQTRAAEASSYFSEFLDGSTMVPTPGDARTWRFSKMAPSPHDADKPIRAKIRSVEADVQQERKQPTGKVPVDKSFGNDSPLKPRVQSSIQDVPPAGKNEPLGSLPYGEQEKLVIHDLLYVLMDIEGVYIQRSDVEVDMSQPSPFRCDSTMDQSIAELVKRILPLAGNLEVVERFIDSHSKFEHGRVQHALAATMRGLVKNYLLLIVQLEHQALTAPSFGLQKLWFYLHPSLTTMSALASLIKAIAEAEEIGKLKPEEGTDELTKSTVAPGNQAGGGALLGILSQHMLSFSGDPVVKALYSQLLTAAAVPYTVMLRTWINSGEIVDPYDEFMVQEKRGMDKEQLSEDFNDVYWDKRYTLRHSFVPDFLKPYEEKILHAGKYLNVVRECGKEVSKPYAELLDGSRTRATIGDAIQAVGGERFVHDIEGAYRYANTTLLSLLFNDYQLLARLRSIKHFYLLEQSDFLVHFLDVAHEHLLKPIDEVPIEQVASLLELVLRNPAAGPRSHEYKEDVSAELCRTHFIIQLIKISTVCGNVFDFGSKSFLEEELLKARTKQSGIQAFQLHYDVPFPTSLIINKKVLVKYQVIFRHLFQCKYIERQLGDAWRHQLKSGLYSKGRRFRRNKGLQLFTDLDNGEDEGLAREREESLFMSRMCALRAKMLYFIQQYMYHVGYEVIEPTWSKFEERLQKAPTIEAVMTLHDDYQDALLTELMLSHLGMVKVFRKLMSICIDFCIFSHSYTRFKAPYTFVAGKAPSEYGVPDNLAHSSHPSAIPGPLSDAYISATGGSVLNAEDANQTLKELETTFVHQMRTLIDTLKHHATTDDYLFGNFATRLDYNLYYARLPPDLSIVVQVPIEEPDLLNSAIPDEYGP
ncbi:hypothetical protein SpCBS45565_g02217 [Spizellomyces sp. 'palustris']|nr:hypothetical protein SpCBS45565_g02217 [Spizellomyces sp. 'palustris']